MVIFHESDIEFARNFGRQNSPCLRRKYGVIIRGDNGHEVFGANIRLGQSCYGKTCARDRLSIPVGQHERVESGAEIHAEQMALINWTRSEFVDYQILIAAIDRHGKPIDGLNNKPCKMCAMMLKYAGFDWVWLPFGKSLRPISVSEVIEEYERFSPVYP